MDIGRRLREERERLGLTQARAAELLGVERKSQLNYEHGTRAPDALYLQRACELGVDVLYVLTGERSSVGSSTVVHTGNLVVLTAEENSLLRNYRHASREGRTLLRGASEAISKETKHADDP